MGALTASATLTGVRVGKVFLAVVLLTGACGGATSVGVPSQRVTPSSGGGVSTTSPGSEEVVDLRTVAWAEVLPDLPGVSVDAQMTAGPGPYVASGVASGYADLGRISYHDLSGDGKEEAVIGLTVGGDMGGTGLIVLTPGPDRPVIIPNDDMVESFGYGVRSEPVAGELLVTYYVGAGWEPPCCLSGQVQQRYRLRDGRMELTARPIEFGNPVAAGFTIDRYYSLINARQYDVASQLLTETARARQASEPWIPLFTRSTAVKAEIGSGTRPDGLVPFRLLITGPDWRGDSFTQVWSGGYSLVYNPVEHQWLLDWFNLQSESA